MLDWLCLDNCRPRTDVITFFENRMVYLEEGASWLFSISTKMKTRENWIRMNKRVLSDLRQNSATPLLKLRRYSHSRALKIHSTTISYGYLVSSPEKEIPFNYMFPCICIHKSQVE